MVPIHDAEKESAPARRNYIIIRPSLNERVVNMSIEEITRRRQGYLGSYFGLLFGWLGLIVIAAGVTFALREFGVFSAHMHTLIYWGAIAIGCSAVVYGAIMFAVTWSFARMLSVQFLAAMSFSIWAAIPICNIIPLFLLVLLASRRGGKASSAGVEA